MKFRMPGRYVTAGLLLLAAAAVLVGIALLTSRGDMTSAAVVIAGMTCAVTGIFILTFSGGEPVDPALAGLLPVQDLINCCRIQSDLGITGTAHFLPPRLTGEDRVMLFNPVAAYTGDPVEAADSFPPAGPAGMVTIPSCDPLLRENPVTLPASQNTEEITRLLQETITGLFGFAPKLSADWQENAVTITMHGYRFAHGCRIIARESPQCCSMHPCPACSLCGTLIAGSMDRVVSLERCTPGTSRQEITAVFTLLPGPDGHP